MLAAQAALLVWQEKGRKARTAATGQIVINYEPAHMTPLQTHRYTQVQIRMEATAIAEIAAKPSPKLESGCGKPKSCLLKG
jgi:hypothetical protein